ncbi:secreted protein [Rhodopirellula sp. SWK7]|nr:secreted protein [Rhodopirellula sp. SWK7]
MTNTMNLRTTVTTFVAATTLLTLLTATTGCQVSLNGQTLPSPYYLQDDVQYFPAGPEFKLPREAAALRAAKAEEKLNQR